VDVGTAAVVAANAPVAGELPVRIEVDLIARHQAHRVRHPGQLQDLDLQGPAVLGPLEGRDGLGGHAGQLGELATRMAQDLHGARLVVRPVVVFVRIL
jgi:hypothetical protein